MTNERNHSQELSLNGRYVSLELVLCISVDTLFDQYANTVLQNALYGINACMQSTEIALLNQATMSNSCSQVAQSSLDYSQRVSARITASDSYFSYWSGESFF